MTEADTDVIEKFHGGGTDPRAPAEYAALLAFLDQIDTLAMSTFSPIGLQFYNQLLTLPLNAVETQAHIIAFQDDLGGISEEQLPLALQSSEFWLDEIETAFVDEAPGSVDAFRALRDAYLQQFIDFVFVTNGVRLDGGNDPDGDAAFLGDWLAGLAAAAEAIEEPIGNGELDTSAVQAYSAEVIAIYESLAQASAEGQGDIDNGLLIAAFCDFHSLTHAFIADQLAGKPTTGDTISALEASLATFQSQAVNGLTQVGDAAANFLAGSDSRDLLSGTGGDDSLDGGLDDDCLDGGEGLDKAFFAGTLADSNVILADGEIRQVSGPDGDDTLTGVERGVFQGGAIAADYDIHDDGSPSAGGAYAILWAARSVLGPLFSDPGLREIELGRWIDRLDSGDSIASVASQAIDYYTAGNGAPDEALVAVLYSNVTGQPIGQADLDQYTGLIDDGTFTQGSLYEFAVTLPDVQALIEPQIVGGLTYTPFDII